MGKSPDAFRTITEVSDWLETPTHVLRFWETKFPALKPVKRAGGRRYYRPGDMALLAGIKALLHEQGVSIKGVQKLLRERGPRHVASQSPMPWDAEAMDAVAWEAPEALDLPAADLAAGMAEPAEALDGEPDEVFEDLALPPPPAEPEGEEALTFLDAVLAGTARSYREGAPMATGEEESAEVVAFPVAEEQPAPARQATPAAGLDGAGLDGAGLDGAGLDGAGLDGAGLDGTGLDGTGLDGVGRDDIGRHGAPHHAIAGHARPAGADGADGAGHARHLLALLSGADRARLRACASRLAPLVARLGAVRGGDGGAEGPLRAPPDSL